MPKEVLIAIIIGIALGIVVAFGFWRANLSLSPNNSSNISQPTPDPIIQDFSELAITQPENNSVVSTSTIKVVGVTNPNSVVTILTGKSEYVVQGDNEGGFEKEVELSAGPNEIVITSYDEIGTETSQKLLVVYSTELEEKK